VAELDTKMKNRNHENLMGNNNKSHLGSSSNKNLALH